MTIAILKGNTAPAPSLASLASCLDPALLLAAALRRDRIQRHGKAWAHATNAQWLDNAAISDDALARACAFLAQHRLADIMQHGRVIWIAPTARGLFELDYAVSASAILHRGNELPQTLGGVANYPYQPSQGDKYRGDI